MGFLGWGSNTGLGAAWNYSRKFSWQSVFDLNKFMRAQRATLAGAEIGGHSLVDPGNFWKVESGPPAPTAPPPPADTNAARLRDISKAQTDQELRASKRSMLYGTTYTPSTGAK